MHIESIQRVPKIPGTHSSKIVEKVKKIANLTN